MIGCLCLAFVGIAYMLGILALCDIITQKIWEKVEYQEKKLQKELDKIVKEIKEIKNETGKK